MREDSLLIKTLRGTRGRRPPIWLMRQAGRYLPEYQEIRARHRMLDVIRTPELATMVTLQPLSRFPLDAAIIFADLLNPLIGMGIDLDFVQGEGPKIFNPITSPADIERLRVPSPEENVGYTLNAIKMVDQELASRNIPVIGFAGAPFTLSFYLIEGASHANAWKTKQFMTTEPAAWHALQEKLCLLVTEYLVAQVQSGASAVQLFDSWVGALAPAEYRRFVAPYVTRIIEEVKGRSGAPVIYFAPQTAGMFDLVAGTGPSALGVDWRLPLASAASQSAVPLQGNLDPSLLFAPWEYLEPQVNRVLREGADLPVPHIFNLGHGILPGTPLENVARLIDCVSSYSEGTRGDARS